MKPLYSYFYAIFILISMSTISNYALKLREEVKLKLSQNPQEGATPVDFAYLCIGEATNDCNFRLFTKVADKNLLLDTGSSTLAFSTKPTTISNSSTYFVENKYGQSQAAAFCNPNYGQSSSNDGIEASHGWFGPAFQGNVPLGDNIVMDNVVYSVIKGSVFGTGNWNGIPNNFTKGIRQPIEGIFGIGGSGDNSVQILKLINQSSWPTADQTMCEQSAKTKEWLTCQCYDEHDHLIKYPVDNPLMLAMNNHLDSMNQRWAITWDGTFPKQDNNPNNKLLFGDAAFASIPDGGKVKLEYNALNLSSKKDWYFFQIESMVFPNSTVMPVDNWKLMFDTGTPTMTLPYSIVEYILNNANKTPVFTFNMKGIAENVEVPLKFTPEFFDLISKHCSNGLITSQCSDYFANEVGLVFIRDEFLSNQPAQNIWGLSSFRFFETIGVDFSDQNNTYFKAALRETPISKPYMQL